LGVKRIYLKDESYILNSHKLISLTLNTVMSENKTFYEKYRYVNCNGETESYPSRPINLTIHKELLRNFNYSLFKQFLNPNDLRFVLRIEKHIENSENLSEFFTKCLNYILSVKEFSSKRTPYLKTLNDIFYSPSYPWYSMISVLENEKQCYEKYIY
jgi:hypothetical protein